jgi:hypothetical protein
MNPNQFMGRLYNGKESKTKHDLNSKFTKLVQHKIFNENNEEYKSQSHHQYSKPNITTSIQKPVKTLYIDQASAVTSQLKNIVSESVKTEIKPIQDKVNAFHQISYLEKEVNRLSHEMIQLKRKLREVQ